MNALCPSPPRAVTDAELRDLVGRLCAAADYRDRRVLLIVPDGTRTAPIGGLFRALYRQVGEVVQRFDVLVALGTHQPMSEPAICRRLEISLAERQTTYHRVLFFNHSWNDPSALQQVGTISAAEIRDLTEGRFALEVPVEVNRLLFDYDQIIIIGPVFPHEVVGFSGGNKYLFPGVAGPRILNFFHWLGAVITTPKVIGHKWTPVRKVVDRAAALVRMPKLYFSLVVDGGELTAVFAGTPESAWDGASELSRERHVIYKAHPFHTVLARAPEMYDEIWTAGKCMYKLEPVVADGGELIIYAPHLKEICVSHGQVIQEVGYHCRDYFLAQWDRFKNYPWGVLAHSTHVFGLGTFSNGVEQPRVRVTLATQIPPETCRRINLGYRDPASLRLDAFADREAEGILMVPKAGEILYRLKDPPAWARA